MSRSQHDKTRWRPATRWRTAVPPGSSPSITGDLIRFVGDTIDANSGQPIGIFQIAARLKRSGTLSPEPAATLLADLRWFSLHLTVPRRFSHHRDGQRRSASGQWVRTPIAISWFKPTAVEHLKKIRELARIIESSGQTIHELRTVKPGYITYEDAYQVVAVPFLAEGAAP